MSFYSASALFLATLVFLPPGAFGQDTAACTSGECHSGFSPIAPVHGTFRDGTCLPCHKPVPGFDGSAHDGRDFTPWGPPADPCGDCHKETASLVSATPHGAAGPGACISCHRPHNSSYPFLLRADYPGSSYLPFSAARYGICWQCHDSALATEKFTDRTGFRQGRRNFHYSHLHKRKGMTCRICHEPHDGDQSFFLRSTLSRNDAGWRGAMIFTSSREGGSCRGGCHKDLAYRR